MFASDPGERVVDVDNDVFNSDGVFVVYDSQHGPLSHNEPNFMPRGIQFSGNVNDGAKGDEDGAAKCRISFKLVNQGGGIKASSPGWVNKSFATGVIHSLRVAAFKIDSSTTARGIAIYA